MDSHACCSLTMSSAVKAGRRHAISPNPVLFTLPSFLGSDVGRMRLGGCPSSPSAVITYRRDCSHTCVRSHICTSSDE